MKASAVRQLTVPILQTLLDKVAEFTAHVGPDSYFSVCLYEYLAFAKIRSKGEDATAFNNRGNWVGITILPSWTKPEYDCFARDWVHSTVDALADAERKDDSVKDAVVGKRGYCNGSDGLEKVTQAFGVNYPRLRKVKKKYDPELLFRKWFPIVPAED